MSKLLLVFFIFFLDARGDTKRGSGGSRIREVTLFKDRAYIKRVKKVAAEKGSYAIVFSQITPLMDVDSIKVLTSGGEAQILGVRAQKKFRAKYRNGKLQEQADLKQKLLKRRENIYANIRAVLREHKNLQLLNKHYNDSFTMNMHNNKWSRKKFIGFLNFLSNRAQKLYGVWRKAYREILKVYDELDFVEAKIRELNSISSKQSYTVYVDLAVSKKNSSLSVEIQYLVSNVAWEPRYDIRVDSKKERAVVGLYALIRQNSGEDWNKVKLILSNMRTELRPITPSIAAYTLNWKEVEEVKTSIKNKQDDAQSLKVSQAGRVFNEGSGLAKNFEIKGFQTLGDGLQKQRIFVRQSKLAYGENLELVASQYMRVFRKGVLKNTFPWAMERGMAAIFYDGEFIQHMWLPTVVKGGSFFINAGIDHSVRVTRSPISKTLDKGLLSKKRVYKRNYLTTLENFSMRGKKIRVLEQIPQSFIDDVTVTYDGSTVGLNKLEGYPSWAYWNIDLSSREKRKIELHLAVTAPADFHFSWD